MVTFRSVVCRGTTVVVLMFAMVGCQTAEPVAVYPSFTVDKALAAQSPAQIAVLPVEDGTEGRSATRHLAFLRQEVMRQIVLRLYTPLKATHVDAALRRNSEVVRPAESTSVLDPTWLKKVAGSAAEDATFALRVDRWNEAQLLVNHRVYFQFQAALVGKDGKQLWYGTLSGEVKAGGAGAAPRDREYMARSCLEIAVRELLLRLPRRL